MSDLSDLLHLSYFLVSSNQSPTLSTNNGKVSIWKVGAGSCATPWLISTPHFASISEFFFFMLSESVGLGLSMC